MQEMAYSSRWLIANIRAHKNRTDVRDSQWVYGQYPDVCSKKAILAYSDGARRGSASPELQLRGMHRPL